MYSLEIYHRVRRAVLRDGMSERAAAIAFGVDRGTISKMLAFSEPPGYRLKVQRPRNRMDDHADFVDQILITDRDVPKKQRHTIKRIFERLRDERGFAGGHRRGRTLAAAGRPFRDDAKRPAETERRQASPEFGAVSTAAGSLGAQARRHPAQSDQRLSCDVGGRGRSRHSHRRRYGKAAPRRQHFPDHPQNRQRLMAATGNCRGWAITPSGRSFSRPAAKHDANMVDDALQPLRSPPEGTRERRIEPFREDLPDTIGPNASESSRLNPQGHAATMGWQICEDAFIAAVHRAGERAAGRTDGRRRTRSRDHREQLRTLVKPLNHQARGRYPPRHCSSRHAVALPIRVATSGARNASRVSRSQF